MVIVSHGPGEAVRRIPDASPLSIDDERKGDGRHDHGNREIEDPPGHRFCKQGLKQSGTIAQAEKPYKGRHHSTCAKGKTVRLTELHRHAPQQDHRIQIDMRIEKCQRKTGGDGSRQAGRICRRRLKGMGIEGSAQRQGGISQKKCCTGTILSDSRAAD